MCLGCVENRDTILYTNARGLPFLATTGGHGTSKWLATVGRGEGRAVIINMRNMRPV
jgi:hypothetical protein